MNVVLMAGGGGTRLWPLSKNSNPKQFLSLGGGPTLLETTYRRAAAVAEPHNIYVATMREYEAKVRACLPHVPAENIFFEPERRDNAAAFASVAIQLEQRGQGDEPTVFMWSDHVFTAEADYTANLKLVPKLLADNPNAIVIFGHVPVFPETGFGYIEADRKVDGYEQVWIVKSFKEKPDLATAEQYVAAGNYFWNIGSISVRPTYLLEQMRVYEPELMKTMDVFAQAMSDHDIEAADRAYAQAKKISIDYALLERTAPIIVVTGDYGWSDVGNWRAVQEIFGKDGDHIGKGHHVHVDSKNNYVHNDTDKVVSLIGMEDTVVVVTADAVLVAKKDQAHLVKDVVARLTQEGRQEYL
jgi:mannose-1-phosphate guanylyltransferase